MSLFITLFTTVLFIIFYSVIIRLYRFIKFCVVINKIPGPGIFPLPLLAIRILKVKIEDRFKLFCEIYNKYEKGIMRTDTSLNNAAVYIRKPHQIEAILPSNELITKSIIYDTLEPWLGKALLTSTGEKWFHQRKMITPAFHFGVVDKFSEIMSEKAEILNKSIEKEIDVNPDKPIDFFLFATRCTLDIICETAMGVNVDAQKSTQLEYITALPKVAKTSLKRLYIPWLKPDWIFYRTKLGVAFKSDIETMTNFTMQIIKKKQEAQISAKNSFLNTEEQEDDTGKRKRKAFLDLLLDFNENEKNPMTDNELREEVETFIFAGHDTTAAAISWIIFNLGHNLEVQENVHYELDEIFGDSIEPATMQQIGELKYLDRVIKESLRLHPPVPGIGRTLTKDIKLDGYVIPKGVNLLIDIFNLHRDPEVWPEPLRFDPDRFLPENCRGRHPYAYVPFSAGPRNCIGRKFAMAELKIVLTALLRKWRVRSAIAPEEIKMHSAFILRSYDGNPIYFTRKSKIKIEGDRA